MFTGDEGAAGVLGLAGDRTGPRTAAPAVASARARARAKIDRVLPLELRERIGAMADTVVFSATSRGESARRAPREGGQALGSPSRSAKTTGHPTAPRVEVLLTLDEATRDRRRIRLTDTLRAGDPSERKLDPVRPGVSRRPVLPDRPRPAGR